MIAKRTYASGGNISIKPENRGKFTSWAESHGMSVQDAARHVMANKGKYSTSVVRQANFAKNASSWKKEAGGVFTDPPGSNNTKIQGLKALLTPPSENNWMYERFPWTNPERAWYGGDTALGEGEDLYINDAGNLERKPQPKKVPQLKSLYMNSDGKIAQSESYQERLGMSNRPLLVNPTVQQSSTFVADSANKMRLKFQTPLFGQGGSVPEQVNAMRLTPTRYRSYADVIHALKNRRQQ